MAPDDDDPDERARGRELMQQAEERIVAGVERLGAAWVAGAVQRVAAAHGPVDAPLLDAARAAGEVGTRRVVTELQALFAADPGRQHATPLEVVRTLRREVTEVLAAAGVPPVRRDPFDERAFPDDVYGVVPRSLSELGDDELGPLLLVWGMGKAKAMRGSV